MGLSKNQLSEILVKDNILDRSEFDRSVESARKNKISIEDQLVENNLIADPNLGKLIANYFNLPFVSLATKAINLEVAKKIPEIFARKHQVIAFDQNSQGLHLAMANPSDTKTANFIEKKFGVPLVIYFATKKDIESEMSIYAKDMNQAFDEIISENVIKAKNIKEAEPPITKIVDSLISYAYKNKASDIHIEPMEEHSLVRFRIDGILHDILKIPKDLHPRIVTRIKVMANLRTDEHQDAQDGKIQVKGGIIIDTKENLDLRVSILPSTDGENVVMRLLSERSRRLSLQDLGLSENNLEKVQKSFKKPYGMILGTGPTGSGKTSTMYAILKILNRREINIMTIEDPVEYDIEGVTQIQVNPKTNLTFAKGLRSIVRQDPDVILVGEIRDDETAGIAVNSAMTGHLVLSTVHTNDSATTIPRLLDLKVEPFLVASTINVIIAQRLVRKICSSCRIAKEEGVANLLNNFPTDLMKKYFGSKTIARSYVGKGCSVCHDSGYLGRIGIFEVLEINDVIRQAVTQKKDAGTIHELAVKSGMVTMLEDGLLKVNQGLTTFEEILRVTKQ